MDAFDIANFRKTLGCFATGVTVVTSHADDEVHGMTANSFTPVSLSPPLVLVSVDNRARMQQVLIRSRRYGVSILHSQQQDISTHFAGRPVSGLDATFDWIGGMPLIKGALAHIVCSIRETVLAGDHTLYIGQVEEFRRADGAPLVFFGSQYATVDSLRPGGASRT